MTDQPPAELASGQARVCPLCGYISDAGTLLCANCGVQLLAASLPDISLSFASTLQQLVQVCPNCGHVNLAGEPACESCGENLTVTPARQKATTDLLKSPTLPDAIAATAQTTLLNAADTPILPPRPDPAYFGDDMVLRLEIADVPTPILLYPSIETIIGRRDPVTGHTPDLDLGVYAGYRHGISRRHAILHLHNNALDVIDLGSSNGTFLNGRPLTSLEPYPLRSGDQLTLGKMVLRVSFARSMQRGGRTAI